MKHQSRIILPVFVATFLMMCSNPSEPESENAPLSSSESEELLNAIMVVMTDTMPKITQRFSTNDFAIICPEGGDARLVINVSDDASNDTTASLLIDFKFTPDQCKSTGDKGTNFILSSSQSIDYNATFTIVGFFEDIELEGSLNGEVQWTAADRSGTCEINMDAELEIIGPDLENYRSLMVGDACDHNLTLDLNPFLFTDPGGIEDPRGKGI